MARMKTAVHVAVLLCALIACSHAQRSIESQLIDSLRLGTDGLVDVTREDIRTVLMRRLENRATNGTTISAISQDCLDDYSTYLLGLITSAPWAGEMADSWGTSESGYSSGNTVWEGRTTQCQRVKPDFKGADGNPYRGRHCFSMWPIVSWYTPAGFGICVPASCKDKDMFEFYQVMIDGSVQLPWPYPNQISRTYSYCEPDKVDVNTPGSIAAITILSIFGLLVLAGTLYDVITLNKRTASRRSHDDGNKNNNAATREQGEEAPPGPSDDIGLPISGTLHNNPEPHTVSQDFGVGHHVPNATQQFINKTFYSSDENVKGYDQQHAGGISMSNGIYKRNTVDITDKPLKALEKGMDKPSGLEPAPDYDEDRTRPDIREAPIVYKPNTCEQLLLAFSAYTNMQKLLHFDHPRSSYQCVNGVRFLAMCWIVLGHTWQLGITISDSPTVGNRDDIGILSNRMTFNVVNQSNISVETFFVLSAMLTTISLMKQFKKDDSKPSCTTFGLYYFHRFWRLTPVYMLLLMMWTVFFPMLRSGPLWPPVLPSVEACEKNWWKHLIYLNNLIDIKPETECFGWTWYLANDFQFYVIAPLFIGLLFWVPIAGYVMTCLAIAGSITAMGYLQHGVNKRGDTDWYYDIYVKPWTRCVTYFIGIFLGYVMYKTKCQVKMNIVGVVFAWIVAIGFVSVAVYAPPYGDPVNGHIAFETLQRPMFALGVFWIVFACSTGYGGIFNSILSWRGWIPLAKLTYTGYLIHPMIIFYTYYSSPVQIYISDWIMIYYFMGTLLLTLGISTIVTVTLEVPFLALEKVMFKNVRK